MSLVICINRLISGIIALSYTSVSDALTPEGTFYGFAALSFVSIWFYYYKVKFGSTATTVDGVWFYCYGGL